MAVQIPPEEELTELAKYYGEDPGLQALRGTKKSGITPVDPLPPAGPALSREGWQMRKLIEATQKTKLVGFTARELKAMGAFTYFESPMASNISSPIHPVFSNWESSKAAMRRRHNPMIPLGKGRDGYWEASNPLVEAALGPCLRLATQFIENPHMWIWWDTMCFGELKPIYPEQRRKDGSLLYSVRPRDPVVVHEQRQRTRDRFIDLASNLTWGLGSGITDPLTGGPNPFVGEWAGITLEDPFTGSILCNLNVDKIEQLLRTDLLAAERLLIQFTIAKTAVHELAHAMWRLNQRWHSGLEFGQIGPEPYFNNEVTAELGHSWINHLLGGREVGITSAGYAVRERQYIASCMVPYPNWRDRTEKAPVLSKVESMIQDDYFPIPIEYFERIQQRDFWNHHVNVFGPQSIHMGPLIHGRRDRSTILPHVPPIDDQEMIITDDAGEEDVAAIIIENGKRLNAGTVCKALESTIAAERSHDKKHINELPQSEQVQQTGTFDSMIAALAAGFDLKPLSWADKMADGLKIIEEPETHNEPARFSEIAAFIISHRQSLGIETMVWVIPELTFLGYINRLGKISITREEFRAFLIHANFTKILFNWENSGLGIVWRRLQGWGPATFPPLLHFTQPKTEHLELMEAHMSYNWALYTRRLLRDLDEDLAFHYFNSSMSSELTKAEYDNLINYYDHRKKWWVRGPLGIVRCIGGVPENVAEERKQRKEEEARDKAEKKSRKKLNEQKRIENAEKRKLEKKKEKEVKQKLKREANEQKQAQMALNWNKAVKRVREQDDPPEDPDPKRRKLSGALEDLANQAKTALTKNDGGEDLAGPMD